jgi:hypothetical protein
MTSPATPSRRKGRRVLWGLLLAINLVAWFALGPRISPEWSGWALLGPALLVNLPGSLIPLWVFGGLMAALKAKALPAAVLGVAMLVGVWTVGFVQWFVVIPRIGSWLKSRRGRTTPPPQGLPRDL